MRIQAKYLSTASGAIRGRLKVQIDCENEKLIRFQRRPDCKMGRRWIVSQASQLLIVRE